SLKHLSRAACREVMSTTGGRRHHQEATMARLKSISVDTIVKRLRRQIVQVTQERDEAKEKWQQELFEKMLILCRSAVARHKRNRPRDLETIEKDQKIYERRNSDPRKWSWKKLGADFGMTESGARAAYRRHKNELDKKKRTD
ncbi:MAG TPA: hypothetical protein VH592_21150, partial [Gemmataceae bacterium]